MFHWICPECGREIPPSVKECPSCDPKAALAAEIIQPAPAAEKIEATSVAGAVETVPSDEVSAVPPPETPSPVDSPVAAVAPEPEPLDTMLAMAEQIRAAQLEAPPDVPLEAHVETAPEPQPKAQEPESSGLAELAAAVGIAEPAAQPVAPLQPVPPPLAIEGKFQPVALLAAPLAAPEATASVAIAEPVVSLSTPSAAPEPAAAEQPPSGSWLPLAPLQDYSRAASCAIRPIAPRTKILTPDSGPRITLPGPTLPPQLASFDEASITVLREPPRRPPRRGLPGWLVSFVVMLGLLVAGGMVVFYLLPLPHSDAETKAPAPVAAPPAPATAAAPVSHPLSQSIEVTGFRFVVDPAKQSEVHYLLVNHSAAGLSGMTVFVTLRAASAKPGQPPLCRFSFHAPVLGPFESREMTSPIEKLTRPVVLPDWQDLRAEVEVAE